MGEYISAQKAQNVIDYLQADGPVLGSKLKIVKQTITEEYV